MRRPTRALLSPGRFLFPLALTLLAVPLRAEEPAAAEVEKPSAEKQAGSAIRDASLRDIYGAGHRFGEFLTEPTEAAVVLFAHPDCPVVRQYLPRAAELHKHYNAVQRERTGLPIRVNEKGEEETYKYAGDKVAFFAVYATPEFSVKDMAAHALEAEIPFAALADSKQELMRALGASRLGEVVLLDAEGNIRYQGMIDDQVFAGGSKPAPTKHYLRQAIDALLAGEEIAEPRHEPQGCRITPLAEAEAEDQAAALTFHKDIEPILQQRCQQCHREGQVGPMPFTTFAETKAFSEMVLEVILDKRMPPWPAESPHKFKDDLRLTAAERDTLIAWLRGGMKQGNPEDAPAPMKWPETKEWTIGEPDFVYEMPEPYPVPASGVVDYVYYPIKVSLPEDKYVKAVEAIPGEAEVVHHIQVLELHGPVKEEGQFNLTPIEQLMLYGPAIEGTRVIGNYEPGNKDAARGYPPGAGVLLPRESNLLLELHYTPNGRPAKDRSKVALVFDDIKPEHEIKTHLYFRRRGDFTIPSNAGNHTMQDLYHFETPVRILALRPHAHLRGKSYRLELVDSADVRLEDVHNREAHLASRGETVLTIPVWDYKSQRAYYFEEPLVVPLGKALLATGYWDNSRHNPRNPDWKQDVPWGLQSHHEMFHTMFIYEEIKESSDDPPPALTSKE